MAFKQERKFRVLVSAVNFLFVQSPSCKLLHDHEFCTLFMNANGVICWSLEPRECFHVCLKNKTNQKQQEKKNTLFWPKFIDRSRPIVNRWFWNETFTHAKEQFQKSAELAGLRSPPAEMAENAFFVCQGHRLNWVFGRCCQHFCYVYSFTMDFISRKENESSELCMNNVVGSPFIAVESTCKKA